MIDRQVAIKESFNKKVTTKIDGKAVKLDVDKEMFDQMKSKLSKDLEIVKNMKVTNHTGDTGLTLVK